MGTEFGVYCTFDGGTIWTQLKSGIPTIAVEDMAIQEREGDLVLATFGRGFYILDNYAPLREVNPALLEKDAYIFPVKDALMYIQDGGRYGQGSNFFYAPNPKFGATFTYYIKDVPKTLKAERQEKEDSLVKDKKPIPIPSQEAIRLEENEIPPYLIFTVKNMNGDAIRVFTEKASKGVQRANWDLHYESPFKVKLKDDKFNPLNSGGRGMLALPGTYTVSIEMVVRGEVTPLAGPVEFTARALKNSTLPQADRQQLDVFLKKVAELTRVVDGAERYTNDLIEQVQYIKQTLNNTPGASFSLMEKAEKVDTSLQDIMLAFEGQKPKASEEENLPAPPSIEHRVQTIIEPAWSSTAPVTQTQKDQYSLLEQELPPLLDKIKQISDVDMKALRDDLDKLNAPWTPGRLPVWKK